MKDKDRITRNEGDIKLIGKALEAINEALVILRDKIHVQELR